MSQNIKQWHTNILNPSNTPRDILQQYAAFDAEHVPFPWTLEQWLTLGLNYSFIEVRNDSNELMGLTLFHQAPGDCYVHLLKIAVALSGRRTGVAKIMMSDLIRCATEKQVEIIGLEVGTQNFNAISLYEQFNAKIIQHKKSFYSDGSDAFMMHIELSVIG